MLGVTNTPWAIVSWDCTDGIKVDRVDIRGLGDIAYPSYGIGGGLVCTASIVNDVKVCDCFGGPRWLCEWTYSVKWECHLKKSAIFSWTEGHNSGVLGPFMSTRIDCGPCPNLPSPTTSPSTGTGGGNSGATGGGGARPGSLPPGRRVAVLRPPLAPEGVRRGRGGITTPMNKGAGTAYSGADSGFSPTDCPGDCPERWRGHYHPDEQGGWGSLLVDLDAQTEERLKQMSTCRSSLTFSGIVPRNAWRCFGVCLALLSLCATVQAGESSEPGDLAAKVAELEDRCPRSSAGSGGWSASKPTRFGGHPGELTSVCLMAAVRPLRLRPWVRRFGSVFRR